MRECKLCRCFKQAMTLLWSAVARVACAAGPPENHFGGLTSEAAHDNRPMLSFPKAPHLLIISPSLHCTSSLLTHFPPSPLSSLIRCSRRQLAAVVHSFSSSRPLSSAAAAARLPNMMRTGAPRALLRPLSQAASISSRLPTGCARMHLQVASARSSLTSKTARPVGLTAFRQQPTSLARFYASGAVYGTSRDPAREKELAGRIMASHPERVSVETSTTQPTNFANQPEEEDTDMMAGVRSDIKTIRETFALDQVPTEAYRIGLAGVLPYLATSAATVVCAFDFNNAVHNGGQGLLMTDTTAEQMLQILEPLQVGYGAVILSFLGAIHWGLEWAGYGGKHGYNRYAIGVLAPAVAWPTTLLPVEYALIAQFLAFNTLYAIDANAASRGWVPPWYQTYRFILTFVVGASIVLSLIGRGQVIDRVGRQPSAADRVKKIGEETLGGLAKQGSGK